MTWSHDLMNNCRFFKFPFELYCLVNISGNVQFSAIIQNQMIFSVYVKLFKDSFLVLSITTGFTKEQSKSSHLGQIWDVLTFYVMFVSPDLKVKRDYLLQNAVRLGLD